MLNSLVWQMQDEKLMQHGKNSEAWLFRADGDMIHLSEAAEKRRYALFSLAAARFLKGDAKGAVQAVEEARGIKVVSPEAVSAIVLSDLERLESDHRIPDAGLGTKIK